MRPNQDSFARIHPADTAKGDIIRRPVAIAEIGVYCRRRHTTATTEGRPREMMIRFTSKIDGTVVPALGCVGGTSLLAG